MRHLNVGQSQKWSVAACGSELAGKLISMGPTHRYLRNHTNTEVIRDVKCQTCLVVFDLMLMIGLAWVVVPRRCRLPRAQVGDRAFPFAPVTCGHRHIQHIYRSGGSWTEPSFTGSRCVDCGKYTPGGVVVAPSWPSVTGLLNTPYPEQA